MLNFRRLRQDFASAILGEGKGLFDEGMVLSAHVVELDGDTVRVGASIQGKFDNVHDADIEICRHTSELHASTCDCSYQYDCCHLAALVYHLEKHLNGLVVDYSSEAEVDEEIEEVIEEAREKESARRGVEYEKELLVEYKEASALLARSAFFTPEEPFVPTQAELAIIFHPEGLPEDEGAAVSLALRLPMRSKPLHIPDVHRFFEHVRYQEPIEISGRQYAFSLDSFPPKIRPLLSRLLSCGCFSDEEGEERLLYLDCHSWGMLLADAYELASERLGAHGYDAKEEGEFPPLPSLYFGAMDRPLTFSPTPASLQFAIEYLEVPAPKLFLRPSVVLDGRAVLAKDLSLLDCRNPGLLADTTYYRFREGLERRHLCQLQRVAEMAIPEPLFGSFVENGLPELLRSGEVSNQEALSQFSTLPFTGELTGRCSLEYADGVLEARLVFLYDDLEVPASAGDLSVDVATAFMTKDGILARQLVEEQRLIEALFQGFQFDEEEGAWLAKTEKRIVEFMTEVLPVQQGRVTFDCPASLRDRFMYDETKFELSLEESEHIDRYKVSLKVDGDLEGVKVDRLWECVGSRRNFIELQPRKGAPRRGRKAEAKPSKILVLDLERLAPIVQLFDELGIIELTTHEQERPLWSLASVYVAPLDGLPVKVTLSKRLKEIQEQMLGKKGIKSSPIPKAIQAELRNYQADGVSWLERLRTMHLCGVLADDMGLGKTVQTICALGQYHAENKGAQSLIVCPTSLLYNWKEEFSKFYPKAKVLVVEGPPAHRKKLLEKKAKPEVLITSYSLLQKDIDHYEPVQFGYAVLDEAQHIKNRGTRNAKSVKQIRAAHRLILTGTPVENSLDELWSLFDYLMPGLLSSYERFVERYIRSSGHAHSSQLETLSRKVTPFILRRMKQDVLDDLPPVSNIVYHCHLSKLQKELYASYATSAREELERLVERQGFDKVQIHVLATLTRLKQICCHPAIFAKEAAEEGDSAKYDMLLELLHSLIEGKHKTVIFSQYTGMLKIIRKDLEKLGIRFGYLDGSTKNRMGVVKEFNRDESQSVFLVSLKAGGTGLNLTGADTVIHYDMWWNPAVESQATDRVHRIGQQKDVSAYKLVTLGTIEEKILELQKRKEGLVKKVVSCDEDAVSKLTWEEVLELLQV